MNYSMSGSGTSFKLGITILSLSLLVLLSPCLNAQDPCTFPGTKKDVAALEDMLKSKQGKEAKIEQLQELLKEAPGNGRILFEIGKLQFLQAENEEIPDYTNAQKSLQGANKSCPAVNPLLDYYLGIIYYTGGDLKNSLKSFKKFLLNGENPDDPRHGEKLEDVRKSITVIEGEMREMQRIPTPAELVESKVLNKVSTDKSEYLPMLSPDNTLLYFTRKSKKKALGQEFEKEVEEFSVANRLGDAFEFEVGTALKDPFNKGGNYGGATVSVNNKDLYITVCIPLESGYKNCDIYESHYEIYRPDADSDKTAYRWTPLKNLGENVNTQNTWEAQPSISPDGKTLYFTRYGKETRETDLYYAEKDETGTWSEAKAFPEPINSAGHDKAPFIHQDGKTMYFASSGRPGEGGFDIYMSVKEDSVRWSRPKNIGKPVNTDGDEHGMLVSTDGKYAMYASNGGLIGEAPFDIYYVELPDKVRPEEIVLLKGKVDQATAETKLQLKNIEGIVIRDIKLDTDDGAYATIIKRKDIKEPLVLGIEQEGVAFEARIIDTNRVQNGMVDNESMTATTIASNTPYTIKDINFETNSAVVMEGSKFILTEFARFLMKNPGYRVCIQGHTDNVGDEASNLQLSNERALAVKDFLISKGVPASRLDHKGFGSSQPLQGNDSAGGRAKNRRTEFILK